MYKFYSGAATLSAFAAILFAVILIYFFVTKKHRATHNNIRDYISFLILFIVLTVCFNFLSKAELKNQDINNSSKQILK